MLLDCEEQTETDGERERSRKTREKRVSDIFSVTQIDKESKMEGKSEVLGA